MERYQGKKVVIIGGTSGVAKCSRPTTSSQCPNLPLLIALHSPYILFETGLRLCHPERSQDTNPDLG
jgi:hypothetical protein